jgi:IS605 OrfB family transposase
VERATKGGQYALHSQRVQALCQKFAANVATATELRQQEVAESGHPQMQYPHHEKLYRQQREILHQTTRKVVDFCHAEGATQIAVGDVRDIQTGVQLGHVVNQKVSQWPHGQFARYLKEKAARQGMVVEWLDEAYSTKTCSQCRHQHSTSPRGRRFVCLGCGVRIHRDVNG